MTRLDNLLSQALANMASFIAYQRFRWLGITALTLAVFFSTACSERASVPPQQTTPAVAEVVFDISPAEATIYMPGLQRPLATTSRLPKGRYLIEVSAPGFENERLWLDIEDAQLQTIQLSLTPKSEPVHLSVWPPGTDMHWRSDKGGEGIITAQGEPRLALGRYDLTFKKPGYQPQQLSLHVEAGGEYALSIALTPVIRLPGEVFSDQLANGQQGPNMVVIPGGEFEQGDLIGDGDWREQPIRQVVIASFALGVTEVTRGAYHAFASATQRQMPIDQQGDSRLPVTGVSYDDAVAYAEWLSNLSGETYRLPSESEWEYAARAGSRQNYAHGNQLTCEMARYDGLVGCGIDEPAPVASYSANAFGLFDMHGNVWEWTADCASEDYTQAPLDGSAWFAEPCYRAMLRGGSYILNAHKLRVSYRSWRYRDYRHSDTGFRLVRELP